ncbi:uncharacterized protein LOC116286276 [Actinia tenebrosa]|uniref:Uncharacterized protein LOC116286276 n=1 Tax=Actinia tenebrosa TaxID=6105 RepID=A0A6P8H7A0_ACTTE|nr:uncharacterized protein LOC116286276 [Actinia tenebrosa]
MTGDQENNGRQLSLDVTGVSTEKGVRITNVWTTNRLPITEENVVVKQDVSEMNHMKDIDLPELIDKKITLLIGSDVPEALCPLEVRSGKKGEPFALRTLLGWTVTGPLRKGSRQRASMNYIHVDQSIGCNESEPVLTNIHDDFVRMYNSEFSECTAEVRECLSVEDQRAKKIMDKTVEFVNGHYQIGLPWKYERPQLSDNKSMAETRLMLLKKRLLKDHKLLTKYTETMEQYISRGHAEKVQASDHKEQSNRTSPRWYLPHHPVMHQQKPEKVRVVYDCAASYNGTSLNEQLLQGPEYTNSLVGVLLRFRK